MEYHAAANVLFDLRQFRPKPGTDSTRSLLSHLDDPHEDLTCVQIAGSNGKGSTARMTESILREHGYQVGLYTSPHFDDLRERITVDGRRISKGAITEYVASVESYLTERAASGDPVTFFEATTALALWYFARQNVDVAVLEVGIGGKFDATSVVDPVASAVTTVSREHTEILGETISEIARDKAHVAPRNGPLVTGATGAARDAVEAGCRARHEERGTRPPDDQYLIEVGPDGVDVACSYEGRTNHTEAAITIAADHWDVSTRIPLLGAHQATNAGIAAALARQVCRVDEQTLTDGLRRATWPGRFEVMTQEPMTVLDGAHNPGACKRLTTVLEEFDYDRLLLVMGAMHEKDHAGMAAGLPTPDVGIVCRPMRDRAEDPAALENVLTNAGAEQVRTIRPVETAVETAMELANPTDCVLVTGSLYTIAEARQRWVRPVIPKRIDDGATAERVLADADVDLTVHPEAPGDAIHEVIKTRMYPRQARWLEEELRARGGACVRSELDETIEEPVDLVLSGTRTQFEDVLGAMATAPAGLEVLAGDIAARVTAETSVTAPENPWRDGPAIMGILNVTPDSFHDGGEYIDVDDAVEQAEAMLAAGADIIDVGGESTRPGAEPVDSATERDRVVPVIEALASLDTLISVDTRKASVARAALDAGADLINDISGLSDPAMRFLAAEREVPIVIGHSTETPVDPGRTVAYDDVVEDVRRELQELILLARQAGIDRSNIIVDPGLGFGKTGAESFELLGRLDELEGLGCPIMVGHSHKSMFEYIGRGPSERLPGTIAATAIAVDRGADIVRVHDVEENRGAVDASIASSRAPFDQ